MNDDQLLQETYRLAKENNRMLHAIRRNAFWGGILKFILYALLLAAPVWFYLTYLNGAVQNLLQTMDKIEGTGQAAQVQLNGFEQAFQDLESRFGFGSSAASTSTSTSH